VTRQQSSQVTKEEKLGKANHARAAAFGAVGVCSTTAAARRGIGCPVGP